MEKVIYVGVDISKLTFCSAILTDKGTYNCQDWCYKTADSIEKFVATLTAQHHVVMEATGTYSSRLAYALAEKNIRVSVVDPRSVKYFARMKNRTSKTDKADAQLLAAYGQMTTPPVWTAPSASLVQLKQRKSLIRLQEKQRIALENQLEAVRHYAYPDEFVVSFLEDQICNLKEQIQKIQEQINQIVDTDFEMEVSLLQTIPGIGKISATVIIEVVQGFEGLDHKNAVKKMAKHLGVAPTVHRSGSSVRGSSGINRGAVNSVKQTLFMPALAIATKKGNDNIFKTFYNHLRGSGKSGKQAVIAVMHKMIRIAIAVLKSKQPFDLEKYGKLA
jgi:transposase